MRIASPYTRATYRYTPLLAVLLAPNEWLHPSFGKFLFAAADIVAGILMYNLLISIILPSTCRTPHEDAGEKSSSGAVDAKDRRAAALRPCLPLSRGTREYMVVRDGYVGRGERSRGVGGPVCIFHLGTVRAVTHHQCIKFPRVFQGKS